MKRLILMLLCGFVFQVSFAAKSVKLHAVFFETDKHELNLNSVEEIFWFIQNNLEGEDYEILVQGHADKRGSIEYNDALSSRRANTVKDALVSGGIPEALIQVSSFGERKPKEVLATSQHLQQNRRVDIIIHSYHFTSIEELQEALSENTKNTFEVDPNQQNLLRGRNGTKILIPAHALVDQNGQPVQEPVEICIQEAIKLEDWIGNNLSTRSGDELLVSGGMMKVSAKTASGMDVQFDPENPATVSIPTQNGTNSEMQIFASTNGDDWTPNGERPFNTNKLDMPDYPTMKRAPFNYPDFKIDYTTKPKRPKPPYLPSEPHEPREVDQEQGVHWYTLSKNKKRKKNVAWNNKQWDKYDRRKERYDRNYHNFKEADLEHQKDVMTYEYRLKLWKDSINEAYINYEKTPGYLQAQRERDSLNELYAEVYRKRAKEWHDLRREKIGEMGDKLDEMGMTDRATLNSYVFNLNEMSWINVDRFAKYPPAMKKDLMVHSADTTPQKVLLVFKDINSTITMYPNSEGVYHQQGVPKTEEVYVFAFKVEDGKPMVCFELLAPQVKEQQLDYRPSSFAEIKKILASFDQA